MALFMCKLCEGFFDDHVCVPYGDDLICEECAAKLEAEDNEEL